MTISTKKNTVLSILIPALYHTSTIYILLEKVVNVNLLNNIEKEIIIVDDCSKDSTVKEIERFCINNPNVDIKFLKHDKNQGKGAALRSAISLITGDITIIQDADLEYEPNDYNLMLPHIISGDYKVVYGSRFLNRQNKHSYTSFYLGGRIVSICTNILYRQHLTDEPTCYKMFKSEILKSMNLKCTGFEFCPEVTAKAIKAGYKILETPIHYYPRSIEEGKKIKWYDGLEAIWVLFKYRFTN